jgi:type I restriction-modification system DNA methylase subunit
MFADNHKVMRQDLIRLISAQPEFEVAGEAVNGKEAVELGRQLHLCDDHRWKYGVRPVGNANYAWLQHFAYKLSPVVPPESC